MQCLILNEKFIFSSFITMKPEEKYKTNKKTLLISVNALYIFDKELPSELLIKEEEKDFLENTLLLKYFHEEIFISNYNDNSIKYKLTSNNNEEFTIKFPNNQINTKEFIKILIIFEGWKISCNLYMKQNIEEFEIKKNMKDDSFINENNDDYIENSDDITKDPPDKIHLFKIIDKYIQNNYILLIDVDFLKIQKKYPFFIKQFWHILLYFQKIKIKIYFDDEISKRFNRMLPETTDLINNCFDLAPKKIRFCFQILDLKSTNLKDNYFEKIFIYVITKSPLLETLDLSHNLLTNKSLLTLIENSRLNINLKNLIVSYNNFSSENLTKIIFNFSKIYLGIIYFDFKGNPIDNNFLSNFNPKIYEDLHNKIKELIFNSNVNKNNNYNNKEYVIFDFRNTNINIEKTCMKFYLKKKKRCF